MSRRRNAPSDGCSACPLPGIARLSFGARAPPWLRSPRIARMPAAYGCHVRHSRHP